DPIDLAANEVLAAVRAHRPAEDDRAGVPGHRPGQRIAKARLADVECIAALPQGVADAAGRRILLVQDDQNGQAHVLLTVVAQCRGEYSRRSRPNGARNPLLAKADALGHAARTPPFETGRVEYRCE